MILVAPIEMFENNLLIEYFRLLGSMVVRLALIHQMDT